MGFSGAFVTGEGGAEASPYNIYDGTNLVSQGEVIVVTINYRLGAMGFLGVSDGVGPGTGAHGEAQPHTAPCQIGAQTDSSSIVDEASVL